MLGPHHLTLATSGPLLASGYLAFEEVGTTRAVGQAARPAPHNSIGRSVTTATDLTEFSLELAMPILYVGNHRTPPPAGMDRPSPIRFATPSRIRQTGTCPV